MTLDAYHASRRLAHQPHRSACYAPEVSLYFDVHGMVLACCRNRGHPLGDITSQSIEEIWSGPEARLLRDALRADDLGQGCQSCRREIEAGNHHGNLAVVFDHLAVAGWPAQMEFALSNTCNLECVMCSGEYSSRIRARREHLPPLASSYGDDFFEQLRPFLPHLRSARFFGGEPFLIAEYQRIWDLMVETGARPLCSVTTNGTVRTRRVEDFVEALPFTIGVSVDGFRRETVESIRVGADYDRLMTNIRWFRDQCSRAGTGFGLTYCLMTANWRELPDFLRFAEDLGAGVTVNRVTNPPSLSLFHLPAHELAEVVRGLEAAGPCGTVLDEELAVLRARLAELEHAGAGSVEEVRLVAHATMTAPAASALANHDATLADSTTVVVTTDPREHVVAVSEPDLAGRPTEGWRGRSVAGLLSELTSALGQDVLVVVERTDGEVTTRLFAFRSTADGPERWVLVRAVPPPIAGAGPTYVVTVVGAPRPVPVVLSGRAPAP